MELHKIFYSKSWVVFSNREKIELGIHNTVSTINIVREQLDGEEYELAKISETIDDGLVAIIHHLNKPFYIHIKNQVVFLTQYLNSHSSKSIDLVINLISERFQVMKTQFSYEVRDTVSGEVFEIGEKIFLDGRRKLFLDLEYVEGDPYIYLSIKYANLTTFLEYTIKKKSYALKTVSYKVFEDEPIELTFLSANNFILKYGKVQKRLKVNDIVKQKKIELPDGFLPLLKKPLFIKIIKRVYVIVVEENKAYILYNLRAPLLLNKANYTFKEVENGLEIKGDIDFKYQVPVNTLISNRGVELAKVNWIDKNKFQAIIPANVLKKLEDLHTSLKFALNAEEVFTLNYYDEIPPNKKIIETFEVEDKVYIIRLSLKKDYIITSLPTSPMYSKSGKFKIKLAEKVARLYKLFNKKTMNLYFEKDASRALESSIYVFENIQNDASVKSINKYILDETSPQYPALKAKYGKNIIERFSFKNYLYIFMADHFVASELSNHVLAVRVYNEALLKKITATPLYFLQHGIMFAKPVDNPMAMGFHKINAVNNVVKNVISSDLEAGEFYKMGYDDSDLMKTGLPKMDGAKLNADANKIAFMPTWRYWEESYILNDEIEKTTYYASLKEVIALFKEAGLLDRLLIVPHNKFTDYVYNNMSEYNHIICKDPGEALEQSIIFITDYSSIIYDSTYRGAYPIFYWADSDYLIEKYQAIPPVNEENAPGIIAKSGEELIAAVKEAIATNYKIPDEIMEKYRRINEFADNNNTKRVVEVLKNDGVL